MKLAVRLLKKLFPKRERERCELREALAYATAHAEDTTRELSKLDADQLRKKIVSPEERAA